MALNKLFRECVPARYANCIPPDVPGISDSLFDGDGVFMWGAPGIGKTYSATAMARRYVDLNGKLFPDSLGGLEFKEYSLSWTTCPRFMSRVRSSFSRQSGTTSYSIIDEYSRALVLVLDDLGAEKPSDFAAEAIYDLLSDRINNFKFTIITSNLSPREIGEWRPALASRLDSFKHFDLPDRDRRLDRP